MFARYMMFIGLCLVGWNSVSALVARSPLPTDVYEEQMKREAPMYDQAVTGIQAEHYYPKIHYGISMPIFFVIALCFSLVIIIINYRRIKKSGIPFSSYDFFAIFGQISLLFLIGYIANYVFSILLRNML